MGSRGRKEAPVGRCSGSWRVTWVSVVSGWSSRSRRRNLEALPKRGAPGQEDAGGQCSVARG